MVAELGCAQQPCASDNEKILGALPISCFEIGHSFDLDRCGLHLLDFDAFMEWRLDSRSMRYTICSAAILVSAAKTLAKTILQEKT